MSERLAERTTEAKAAAERWFIDRNHSGRIIGIAPVEGRRHDLDMICTFTGDTGDNAEENAPLILKGLNVLTSPADHVEELLGELRWYQDRHGDWCAKSVIGDWQYNPSLDWAFFSENKIGEGYGSAEAAKAACWSDYVSRMRAAFKGAK